ncbi:Brevis radix-like domain-containing protein [Cynara cardunculus var. scolymus]|uniref:Brevis radix-like domain-containing protein n=1 Tax=Cynara cardunculus var. scolymus TaxID=59895 RepID=A0A103Y5S4_CYNCS|nr:Brevis radix-like domain-containing protein [Cynara cardunculus var. scolymus]
MADRFLSLTSSDRAVEQDERTLMWFSGKEEKQLQLSSVTNIIRGHGAICKDKVQADSWFLGLKALISKCRDFGQAENRRGIQSCVNSPTSFILRKYNLGLSKETTKMSQVRSVCGSPIPSLSDRCFSDGLSLSSDSFYSRSSLSSGQNLTDGLVTNSPCVKPEEPKKKLKTLSRFVAPSLEPKKTKLTDVLIWGEGVRNGPLGGGVNGYRNETQVDALLPKVLDSVGMLDVEKISLAGKHAALVTKQGEVFCWGDGKMGRLGDGICFPKEVESLVGVRVKSVSCSEYQTCAVTSSDELYTWGDKGSGESIRWLPHLVSGGLNGISVSKVACGEWHTAIVSTSGQLFTFGDGTFGVLGHGNCQSLTEPKQVESLKGMLVKSVACGPWHTAAVVGTTTGPCKSSSAAGKLFTWGDGDNGRLGHSDHETKLKPTCIVRLVDHEFVQVSCGRMLTVGLTSTGVVYTIGSSVHGQLGNPQTRNQSVTLVQGKLKFEFVKEIASGSYHVAVLTSKGNVYTWGKGANGQLGLGDTEDRTSPTLVESLRHRQVWAISCGSSSTAAICAHRSITSSFDISVCRGCNIEFGFMKKKHNCYNCGLLFCGICSSKKTKNACLAPDETKSFRVCDSCFKCVERNGSKTGQLLNIEDLTPRPLMIKTFSEETDDQSTVTSIWNKTRDRNQVGSGSGSGLGSDLDLDLDWGSSLMSREPRWGQVSSPASFRKHCNEEITRNNLNIDSHISPTVKHKRAKDVIKALTSRLHLMSPRAFMRKQAKSPVVEPTMSATHLSARSKRVPCDAEVRGVNDSCNSALVSSMHNNISTQSAEKRPSDEAVAKEAVSEQNKVKQKHEWMEEYQTGVYITFIMLPTGQKGIKRVRFSRKVFREKEAERWWEDNQQKVYDNYNVDGYINSY